MNCELCGKEIVKDKLMIASDRPYKNYWYHKACWGHIRPDILIRRILNVTVNNSWE